MKSGIGLTPYGMRGSVLNIFGNSPSIFLEMNDTSLSNCSGVST